MSETRNKTLTVPVSMSPSEGAGDEIAADFTFLVVDETRPPRAFRLRDAARAVIGRTDDADLTIDRPSVSRRHARLSAEGSVVRIEDLGSANGTRLRGTPLVPNEPVEIHFGDVVEVGSAMLILQRPGTSLRPANALGSEEFEARLSEECARALRYNLVFSVIRVEILSTLSEAHSLSFLASVIRPTDAIAPCGTGEYEILLVGYSAVEAQVVMRRIAEHVEARDLKCRIGAAAFPRDGKTAIDLLRSIRSVSPKKDATHAEPAGVVIRDPRMREIHALVERVAAGRINVLLLGETGVGKEILAEAVHRHSSRRDKAFLRLNCGAFTESLLESELFGHERGAFTGAMQTKLGLLETAQGERSFSTRSASFPPSVQVKLLRVLEERQVRRIGGLKSNPIDVRFVSATNRDLEAEIRSGRFRQDLFFRLNGVSVAIPPLRERIGEIEGLAVAFLKDACEANGLDAFPSLSDAALTALRSHSWPGNIRELRNAMERAALFCTGPSILPEHLPIAAPVMGTGVRPVSTSGAPAAAMSTMSDAPGGARVTGSPSRLDGQIADLERQRIIATLDECVGNQSRAAKALGISRRRLIARMEEYGLPRPRKGRKADGDDDDA